MTCAKDVSDALGDIIHQSSKLDLQDLNNMNVKFGNVEVEQGHDYTKNQTSNKPNVEFIAGGENDALYTVVMFDPDAPSRSNPRARSWLHWVVTNVPKSGGLSRGDTAMEYNGPTPPRGTGPHRYILLILRQSSTNKISLSFSGRPRFDINQFIAKNEFEKVTAGTYFTVTG